MTLTYRVTAIPGDGIGPEVVAAARTVLDAAGARFGFAFAWSEIHHGRRRHRCVRHPHPR